MPFPLAQYRRQLPLYFLGGCFAALIDIGGFLLLFSSGVWYIGASLISGSFAFVFAFLFQKYVVFQSGGSSPLQFLRYCCLALWNVTVVTMVLALLVEWGGVPEEIAKVISNTSVVLWNFFLYKFVIYA